MCFTSDQSFTQIPYDYQELTAEHPETAHAGILQNFTNAILRGEALLAPGVEGIHELTISNAAYLSAWRGSVPLTLPLDNEAFDAGLEALAAKSGSKSAEPITKYNTEYQKRWQITW